MGFFNKIFKGRTTIPEHHISDNQPETSEESNDREAEFETLRDDGIRAMRIGEANYAERCFEAALQRKDDDGIKGLLAELYIQSRCGEKALPILEALLQKHPHETKLRIAAMQAADQCSDWDRMETDASELQRQEPDNPNALYFQAQAAYGKGNDIAAVAFLTQLSKDHPDLKQPYLLRAKTLYRMQQYSEALKDIETVIGMKDGKDEESLLLQGDILKAMGLTDKAIQSYEEVNAMDPFHQEAILKTGDLLAATGHNDKALSLYNDAIELQPDFAQAYKARGGLRLKLHDEAGAADDLKKALELAPEEAKHINGEYNTLQSEMNARYRAQNPFNF